MFDGEFPVAEEAPPDEERARAREFNRIAATVARVFGVTLTAEQRAHYMKAGTFQPNVVAGPPDAGKQSGRVKRKKSGNKRRRSA